MRNFFYRLQNSFARFMYGRNGMDALNQVLFFSYLAVWLVGSLLGIFIHARLYHALLEVLMMALSILVIFRLFSKNLTKRRAENQKFLTWVGPKQQELMARRARQKDKAHRYFTCGNCGTVCRVPVGKGKIEITCPKCGSKIQGKT